MTLLEDEYKMSTGSMGWVANFELSWRILEFSVKDVAGITSDIWKNESGTIFLKGFSLQIPPSSAEEALIIALEKGNRIANILSSIHLLPVEAYLHNITEIKPEGETKTGIAQTKVHANIHQPVDLDFASVKKLLDCNDPKALRQLAHYSKGLRYSSDPINQLREFYLVLEDEYGKNHSLLIPYRYVRNALCHPELLDSPNQIKKLLDDIGERSLDPSSPKAMELIKAKAQPLKKEAETVVGNIFKRYG
ncbi:MAG: hypothetical protein ABR985_02595 [Methanotrichaceae archaeon]|jgi:hypothetical protein